MEIEFRVEKETKNTIRFEEVVEHEGDTPKLGLIYIPKGTLGEIKWADGNRVIVSLKTKTD